MRTRLIALALGSVLLAGCDKATKPSAEEDVAARFDRLAGEMRRAGDPLGASIATNAAGVVRAGVQVKEVGIAVDGVSERYSAIMSDVVLEPGDTEADDHLPEEPFTFRTLIAWRGARIDRLLYISSTGDAGSFQNVFEEGPDSEVPLRGWALGLMMDGRNAVWVATGGETRSTGTAVGGECRLSPAPPGAPPTPPVHCEKADYMAEFEMTAEPAPSLFRPSNTAKGTRSLAMARQAVAGLRLRMTVAGRPLPKVSTGVWR